MHLGSQSPEFLLANNILSSKWEYLSHVPWGPYLKLDQEFLEDKYKF